jgi:hypothetical protein
MLAAKGGFAGKKPVYGRGPCYLTHSRNLGAETGCGGYPLSFPSLPNQSAEQAPEPIIVHFIQIFYLSDIISPASYPQNDLVWVTRLIAYVSLASERDQRSH